MNFARGVLILFLWGSGLFTPGKVEALDIPPLTSPVMDQAKIIDSNSHRTLDQVLRKASQKGLFQLTILTIPSLEGEPIEQFSMRVVDQWKLGKKGEDKGVLFLVVSLDKKARIEVGRGLEGDIPDVMTKRILADTCRPYFKRGLYGEGILAGTSQLLRLVNPDFVMRKKDPLHDRTREEEAQLEPSSFPLWVQILIVAFLVGFVLLARFFGFFWTGGGGRGGRGGFGGGSGGGPWTGGGGGFGGGGSNDSW